uniref:protein lifeguard 3-like n=1 Tax=Pristiophorus japonicus TaxID=55135 RepID=UPI00398E4C76
MGKIDVNGYHKYPETTEIIAGTITDTLREGYEEAVDFTSCGGLFCALGIGLFVSGIVVTIVLSFKYIPWLHMLYSAIAAIVFTLFLAFDTQLILGNRRHSISPEEYVYGALRLYTDIVQIFTHLLQLFGSR